MRFKIKNKKLITCLIISVPIILLIMGMLFNMKWKQQNNSNQTITENQIPIDWKVYTDTKNSFSLKYPKEWEDLGSTEDEHYFSTSNVKAPLEMEEKDCWLTVTVKKKPINMSFNNWLEQEKTYWPKEAVTILDRKLFSNNKAAFEFIIDFTKSEDTEGGYVRRFYIETKPDMVIFIEGLTFTEETLKQNSNIIENIINSIEVN